MRPARIEVNPDALQHNLNCIRQLAPHSRILAMVKANAYGHDLRFCVNDFNQADGFGVSCLEEALVIRTLNKHKKIVLVEGVFEPSELILAEKNNCDLVVHDLEQVRMLELHRAQHPFTVWMKVNTGMNRLGLSLSDVETAWERLINCISVFPPPYLMTHFADANEISKPTTRKQIQLFQNVMKRYKTQYSLANSAGILAWPESHADWVRPGIMLYGVSPLDDHTGAHHGLMPAMTLKSAIIAIHDCQKGDAIGYGGRYICPHDQRIGIVGIGYGDGYPRHIPDGTPIIVDGKQTSIIGNVSMDMLAVDLQNLPDVKIGAPVILWGPELPVETIAQYAKTISYELLCRMQMRAKRFHV